MELWCKDFSVLHLKAPDVCFLKVCGANSCCLGQATTPGGACSQVSTDHTVPDSRWGEVKVFGEGKSGSKSHIHLRVTLSDDLGKDLCWTALQQMVIEPGQVRLLH